MLGNSLEQELPNWYYSADISPFLIKFDSSGSVNWVRDDLQLLSVSDPREVASGLAIDDQGDLLISGITGAETKDYLNLYYDFASLYIDYGRLFVSKLDGDDVIHVGLHYFSL